MRHKYGKRKFLNKRLLVGGLVLLVVIIAGLELTGVTHIFHKNPAPAVSGSSFSTKGEPTSSSKNASGSGGTSSKSGSAGTPTELIAPSGSFVSNHHPNLSGSPAPNSMSSVCNTTPGASCQISFTKDGVTKSLDAQTADSNGATYWNWKLQDIGLTEGTWKIQASATLNGQIKTASDVMDLVVAQ